MKSPVLEVFFVQKLLMTDSVPLIMVRLFRFSNYLPFSFGKMKNLVNS